MIRLVIKAEYFGPDGITLAPEYKTFDLESPALEKLLDEKPGSCSMTIIGAERSPLAVRN